MALTINSMCYYATLEQTRFIAECAGLREDKTFMSSYYYWEDKATAGGGCRITFCKGIAWVSRHSGYPHADITGEVCALFKEIGCELVTRSVIAYSNPEIYGIERLEGVL